MGISPMENDINWTLSEIQKGTSHIDQLTFESTDVLTMIKNASDTVTSLHLNTLTFNRTVSLC